MVDNSPRESCFKNPTNQNSKKSHQRWSPSTLYHWLLRQHFRAIKIPDTKCDIYEILDYFFCSSGISFNSISCAFMGAFQIFYTMKGNFSFSSYTRNQFITFLDKQQTTQNLGKDITIKFNFLCLKHSPWTSKVNVI